MNDSSHDHKKRIVIIGGGITGLAAAHRFAERGEKMKDAPEIVLLEASPRLGGIIQTVRRDRFLVESGPDSFISEKPAALNLAKRLGIASRLIETNAFDRRSFIVREGSLRAVPEGFQLLAPSRFWPFLTTDIFSWAGKARMALDLFLPRRAVVNGDDESLAEFVRRRLGQEALERMAQPMVGGIYTADPENLSLRATMPRFLEMERDHRSLISAMWRQRRRGQARVGAVGTSGPRYSLFLSFDEGMQVLVDELATRLGGVSVRLKTKVSALTFDEEMKRWRVSVGEGETISADAVCLALPSYTSAALLRETKASLAHELEAIPYASTATINLAFKRSDIHHPLNGFGFVVPFIERRSLLACTFSSVKFAARAPLGHALLRAFVGGALQPEMYALDEDAMVEAVCRDLRQLLGITSRPLFAQVSKWPRSMAQYHLGHIERVRRIRQALTTHPTLKLAGNAFDGAGIPDCIRSGETAADELIEILQTTAPVIQP
jgi:oxygen-dependent protoporphyrinogen oxidase